MSNGRDESRYESRSVELHALQPVSQSSRHPRKGFEALMDGPERRELRGGRARRRELRWVDSGDTRGALPYRRRAYGRKDANE